MPDPGKDTKTEGGKPKIAPPEGYTPLSVKQRQDWNNFLDYLNKEGIAGHPELDQRDQTLGLSYLDKYTKANPGFSIKPTDIPFVQYEQQMLRRGDSFPTMSPEQLQVVRSHLQPAYMNRPLSNVDSWLGSLTSKQYYPQGRIVGAVNKDYGVNFEDYANALLGK